MSQGLRLFYVRFAVDVRPVYGSCGIRMADLMAYKHSGDREREAILDELVRDAQERDMGYGRP